MHSIKSNSRHVLLALCLISSAHADLVLETETAELGKKGDFLFSQAIQVDREKDGGSTIATVNQFEFGLSDRAELLIEPFFYEWNNPKVGKSFQGVGDLEITPSYMVMIDDEKSWLPSALLAFKLKVPTATNRDIGTGEFDYQPYIILGKNFGSWICNFNLGYDFVTSSKDEKLKDQIISDFSVEYKFTPKFSMFAEIFANSSPAKGENGTFAGAIATEYRFTEHFSSYLSVGYDSDSLLSIRPGFNIEF